MIHRIFVVIGSFFMRAEIDETISAFAGGLSGCFFHVRKLLSLQMCTTKLVSILWKAINVVRKRRLDAMPNSSALIELFEFVALSAGPDQTATVLLVVLWSL